MIFSYRCWPNKSPEPTAVGAIFSREGFRHAESQFRRGSAFYVRRLMTAIFNAKWHGIYSFGLVVVRIRRDCLVAYSLCDVIYLDLCFGYLWDGLVQFYYWRYQEHQNYITSRIYKMLAIIHL